MNGAFYIGATGLRSQQRALDVIANNIANINTPAFKRSQVRFSELVSPPSRTLDGQVSGADAVALLGGVDVSAAPRVFTQGDLKQTGKPMDIAVNGEGFLELLGPAGQAVLWRGGTLSVNPDGYLAADNGMPLKAMISVPAEATALTIDPDGKVRLTGAGDLAPTEAGQIDLVRVKDLEGVTALGEGFYEAAAESDLTTISPGEEGAGVLQQGALESSNVQLSDEMVTLLLMQRAYAANAQVVQAGDQLMAIANGLRR
jgi:flagellar basal-body rod protein FlgG